MSPASVRPPGQRTGGHHVTSGGFNPKDNAEKVKSESADHT